MLRKIYLIICLSFTSLAVFAQTGTLKGTISDAMSGESIPFANVVIEKDTNTGIVYKNNVDKFINMNMQDIIDKSMEKLNKHLKDFYNESMKDDENDE